MVGLRGGREESCAVAVDIWTERFYMRGRRRVPRHVALSFHPFVFSRQRRDANESRHYSIQLSRYPILLQLEESTQIPKAYGVIIAIAVFLSTIFINSLALPVSNFVGWALPAYLSHIAIDTPQTGDDVQWLTYWTVFGFFTFLESLALRPVLYYVPYYFPIKTAFVLWLQLPATRVSFPAGPRKRWCHG